MRLRLGFLASSLAVTACFYAAACNFGVDLDNLFGQPGTEGGTAEASTDGGPVQPEAGIPTVEVQQLAMGDEFGCGRRVDGTVMCWGVNDDSGELGDGTLTPSSQPVLVKDVADAVDLAIGRHHGCVVRKTGGVSCWGDNSSRQLGEGTTTSSRVPRNVLLINDAEKVALGERFSCALKKDKTVHCWGDNTEGQLGDGTTSPRSQPAPVKDLANVTQITAASSTACALVAAGDVYCWGYNANGQVGGGKALPDRSLEPVKVPTLSGIVALGAGGAGLHLCAVGQAGDVKCWGYGGGGRLGNATAPQNSPPVAAVAISDGAGVTANGGHTCTWSKSGAVSCWGVNDWRQVGVGDNAPPDSLSSPVQVAGLSGIKQVAAGQLHSCALASDGKKIWCWGANTWGALGRGTRVVADTPAKLATTAKVVQIGLGTEHGCLVDDKGALQCWGNNGLRQQSIDTYAATGTPTVIPVVTGVSRAAGGDYDTCTLVGTTIRCWGHNQYGALGNGATAYIQDTPVTFGAPAAIDVGVGYLFACALLQGSGDVMCAGRNDDGRLGRPGLDSNVPVLVQGGALPDGGADGGPAAYGATKLGVGNGHSCVVHAGKVGCWGSNNVGQLGFSGGATATPTDVAGISTATEIAVGGGHTCALLADQSVRCWGGNSNGQVTGADPNGPSQRTPNIAGKKAKSIACGSDHTCAAADDGTVYCWGRGRDGELGNGVRADSPAPTQVSGLANVKTVVAKGRITCAVLDDGSASCWGLNHIGQLGEGAVMTTGVVANVVGY